MNSIKTANIMLIALLVVCVAALAVSTFSKSKLPTTQGEVTLKKDLFGLTIHKGTAITAAA